MTDPPRHTCRGRSTVCQGPCNPLRAHQHHHHHHHHRYHHQKNEATSITSRKDISFHPDEVPLLLNSLKSDIPVISEISKQEESISRTSSITRIAFIKVSKTPRPEEIDIPATILRKVLSQKKLEKLEEASTSKSPPLRKIDTLPMRMMVPMKTTVPTKTTVPPKTIIPIISIPPRETTVRTEAYRAPRIVENAKFIITNKLNRLIPKKVPSFFLFLIIFIIYAGIHVLLAIITWRTSIYQYFVCSQICGILVFLMWRITGTILI